jgi:ferredoxin
MVDLNPIYVATIVAGERAGLGKYHLADIEYLGEPWEKFVNKKFDVLRRPISGISHMNLIPGPIRNAISERPVIDPAKCIKCGICVNSCPVEGKALQFQDGNKKNPPVYDYKKCIRCYCCQETCPENAITVSKPSLARLFGGK